MNDLDSVIVEVPTKLTEDDNLLLLGPFTVDEFKKATFHMYPDKTSGPDGLNAAFYWHFWDTCSHYIFQACLSWLNEGIIPSTVNKIQIALIHKCNAPSNMKDLRPISLCNVVYKILSNTLANRLARVIGKCVSEDQSAIVARTSSLIMLSLLMR